MSETLPLHGGQLRQIAEQLGIPAHELFDFSANINREGPPAAVLSLLRTSLDNPSTLTSYPDLSETVLKRSLAHYAGVRPENIVVGNGFVPLLDAVLQTLQIRTCLLPVPAFVEYRRALTRARVEIVPRTLTCDSGFSYDITTMSSGYQDAILLANPQNPSGVLTIRELLLELTIKAAVRNQYVLLDEAFIDYCPEASLARETNRYPNLIVFRSLTKFFGMPGMRVAYAVTNQDISGRLQEAIAPWSITTLASIAASVAVEDTSYASRTIALNGDRRNRLQKTLGALDIHVYSSAANFLLFRLQDLVDPEAFWKRMILDHRVVLRNCANYEALPDRHFRAAVRNDSENSRLVEAISQALASLGMPPAVGEDSRELSGFKRQS
jgi:threonine-phosphate decarboxylase